MLPDSVTITIKVKHNDPRKMSLKEKPIKIANDGYDVFTFEKDMEIVIKSTIHPLPSICSVEGSTGKL